MDQYMCICIQHNIYADTKKLKNKNRRSSRKKDRGMNKERQENYYVDNENRRRSQRIHRIPKPFWHEERGITDDDDKSHYDENGKRINTDLMNPYAKINNDKPEKQQRVYKVSFPYNIECDLAVKLYNKLFTPKFYQDKLQISKLKYYQKIGQVTKAVMDILKNGNKAKESNKFISNNFPNVKKGLKNEAFKVVNGILRVTNNTAKENNEEDKQDKSTLQMYNRIFIPNNCIHTVLYFEHRVNMNHPGCTQLYNALKLKYYWPYMQIDCDEYVRTCIDCQLAKGTIKHKVGKLNPIYSTRHGEVVHFDFAGPFYKKLNILIMVDNYTGIVALQACPTQTSEQIALALLQKWYPYYGLPEKLITDRGTGFTSEGNRVIYKALGIRKIFTSSYHPQTNAKAERMVQEVKKALKMCNISLNEELTNFNINRADNKQKTDDTVKKVILLLPSIQFGINQTIHSGDQVSPHMLVYGRNMNDLIDLDSAEKMLDKATHDYDRKTKLEIVEQIRFRINQLRNRKDKNHAKYVLRMKENYDLDKIDHSYKLGDLVAYYIGKRSGVNKKMHKRFAGPYRIVSCLRDNVVKIQLKDQSDEPMMVHVSMIKPYNDQKFIPEMDHIRTTVLKNNMAADRYLNTNNDKQVSRTEQMAQLKNEYSSDIKDDIKKLLIRMDKMKDKINEGLNNVKYKEIPNRTSVQDKSNERYEQKQINDKAHVKFRYNRYGNSEYYKQAQSFGKRNNPKFKYNRYGNSEKYRKAELIKIREKRAGGYKYTKYNKE